MRRWLGGRPPPMRAVTLAQLGTTRQRSAGPFIAGGTRRALQDWPGAGLSPPVLAPRLAGCRTWVCQLQAINWERIEATTADLAVIDCGPDGHDATRFSRRQVQRMRSKPGGGQTAVLCYLSIGAAEPWRSYWPAGALRRRPRWMDAATGTWAGSRHVRYWDPSWHDILYAGAGAQLDQILDAGFDGVALGGVECFAYWLGEGVPQAPDAMIDLVARIGARAWRSNPAFLVVPINGEALLASPPYRSVISAVIREDILFSPDGTQAGADMIAHTDAVVSGIAADLAPARADGIAVLALERLRNSAEQEACIPQAARRLRAMGLVPAFAPRNLDSAGVPIPPEP